ncbi:MAG: hypothetical protein R3F11_29525 [Verrucomicrobiales bacterium]
MQIYSNVDRTQPNADPNGDGVGVYIEMLLWRDPFGHPASAEEMALTAQLARARSRRAPRLPGFIRLKGPYHTDEFGAPRSAENTRLRAGLELSALSRRLHSQYLAERR